MKITNKNIRSLLFLAAALMPLHAAPLDFQMKSSLSLAGAEISAFDPVHDRAYVTSTLGLQVINLSNPSAPTLITNLDLTAAPYSFATTDITSVAVHGSVIAIALPDALKINPGKVVFLSAVDYSLLGSVVVGSLPDHLTFSPDGTKVLTANEGEFDPGTTQANGSVSIIDLSSGVASATVNTVDFTSYNGQETTLRTAGVRLVPGATASEDLEPEYLSVSADGTKAMVTLQEANSVALLDLATATFTAIVPLGHKDFSTLFADFSDRDNAAGTGIAPLLRKGNPVKGMYMPDAIASFESAGQTYYVIANEGDDRNDFLSSAETTTVGAVDLDNTIFPDEVALKTNARLGRLVICGATGMNGDTDSDGDIDEILSYGGRSFSILNSSGAMVYDSGDLLDRAVMGLGTPSFDDARSDNKGSEPEGVTIGSINGRTYAFICLERARSVIAADITNPTQVEIAGFASNSTDRNPESSVFVSAANSPSGTALLLVTNETSNTFTTYEVKEADYTLQLLHLADAEAGLLASQTAPNLAALVDAFDDDFANTLILAGGDNFIPSPFLNAGTDPVLNNVSLVGKTAFARPDIAIHNAIGVEASAIGNHEWDLGTGVFIDAIKNDGLWVGAQFPHISLNLDYSGDSTALARYVDVTLDGATTNIPETSANKTKLVPTAVITKGGQKIGLVGVTTQLIESISSPSGTEVKGFPTGLGANGEVDNMVLLASQIQPYVNELIAEGVNKIVLMAHLQQIANEQSLATKLQGVDIILAAGSNTRLGDADDTAIAYAGHSATFADTYPIQVTAVDGKKTVIVNTDNEFTYLGRLVVDFDAAGNIITPNLASRVPVNGAYASTTDNVAAAWGVPAINLATTAFASGTKGAAVKSITDAVQGVINTKDGTVYGITNVYLEGERAFVRSEETNLGNITADANTAGLRKIIGGTEPIVSLKNGGGIRAQIGAVSSDGGSATKLPPPANPSVNKPVGGVSLLDIENALRFNNKLITFVTNPVGLKAILEHGVASYPNQGRFPQVGGVAFAWDPTATANQRILSISLIGADGLPAAAIYQNGAFVANAPSTIRMVTLNFLADNGDGYPMKVNGENFQYLLDNNTLGPVLDESTSFTSTANLPANPIGEQAVLAQYLTAKHPTADKAYTAADTSLAQDLRIQRTNARTDVVLPFTAEQSLTLNRFSSGMLAIGQSPSLILSNSALSAAVTGTRTAGQTDVTANPSAYNLYTATSIQDLRGTGNLLVQASGANVSLTLPVEKSTSLDQWAPAGSLLLEFPKIESKEFYRVILPE